MTFHVPNKYRHRSGPMGSDDSIGNNGAFFIPNHVAARRNSLTPPFKVIATDGQDFEPKWEHVSVSLPERCPTWEEMCYIKDIFWDEEDCVVQFHPPHSAYVNNHQYCLHLWRQVGVEFQLPPTWMVGIK